MKTKLTFKNFNSINPTKLIEQNSLHLIHVEINLAFIKKLNYDNLLVILKVVIDEHIILK